MKSLWETEVRNQVLERIQHLTPDQAPRWGQMDAGAMVCHVSAQLKLALGEITLAPELGPLRNPIMRQLVAFWLPWPKAKIDSPQELLTNATNWEEDLASLEALLVRCAEQGSETAWPDHPFFGSFTGQAWGVFSYRHFNHHLRQFGV